MWIAISVLLFALLVYVLVQYIKIRNKYMMIKNPSDYLLKLKEEIHRDELRRKQLKKDNADLTKDIEKNQATLKKSRELCDAVAYAIENKKKISADHSAFYDEFCPSVILNLHAMDSKDLKKEYNANAKLIDKQITETIAVFDQHFQNKAISSVYKLTVIAMQAELQNILYTIQYNKMDDAVSSVKSMTTRYYTLASESCQTITGALKSLFSKLGNNKTIDEEMRENILRLEYLFMNSVKIEYNYYVKKEQAKAEQAALREQMRVEAAERKALAEMQKKVEKEESKYNTEIEKLESAATAAVSDEEKEKYERRIAELQMLLAEVDRKKEEIATLQNGKAGTVYIISNLGSFGENVFKIGMTRRMVPQERVDELGDASVPFRFDVHSFIFSEDAPALETKLHTILTKNRVNKVNLKKEFFRITIDELQKLVYELDPTATFNTTMAAEEYRQSLSTEEVYTSEKENSDIGENETGE